MMTPDKIYPAVSNLPSVTTTQMIEVDRRMMEDIGISLFQMMENAGLQLASVARDVFLGGTAAGKRIAVLVGTGGNAGGAIVAARRLSMWGAQCDIGLGKSADDMAAVPAAQFDILRKISAPDLITPTDLHKEYDLILDGLIGYSLKGNPYGKIADFIQSANAAPHTVLSLDVPSGFDGETGNVRVPCINADATLTLALPKFGMMNKDHANNVGQLFCADISCPPQAFENLNLDKPYNAPFSNSPIVQVI